VNKQNDSHPSREQTEPSSKPRSWFTRALHQDLPLQDQTTFFILANVLDIVMTNFLIRFGAIETNPIANWIFLKLGFPFLIAFKMLVVATVCVIAQVVAQKSLWKAKALLNLGTAIVFAVVIYSLSLVSKLPID